MIHALLTRLGARLAAPEIAKHARELLDIRAVLAVAESERDLYRSEIDTYAALVAKAATERDAAIVCRDHYAAEADALAVAAGKRVENR